MTAALIPQNETERIVALRHYRILDTEREPAFDELAQLASSICDAPIALISLVDTSRQWFKAHVGLEAQETPRSGSFCAHALHGAGVFIVQDALADPRFATNPLVLGDPHIRFYAGAPLTSAHGLNLGTLCVIDRRPRVLDEHQHNALIALARQVMALLELRVEAGEVARLKSEFAATVSHELRTPLTSIHGCLSLLSAGVMGELSVDARQLVATAERNSIRLMNMINELLDFERLERGVGHATLQADEGPGDR
jgi:GAF domain-containing protein